jgi:hypothetical protein
LAVNDRYFDEQALNDLGAKLYGDAKLLPSEVIAYVAAFVRRRFESAKAEGLIPELVELQNALDYQMPRTGMGSGVSEPSAFAELRRQILCEKESDTLENSWTELSQYDGAHVKHAVEPGGVGLEGEVIVRFLDNLGEECEIPLEARVVNDREAARVFVSIREHYNGDWFVPAFEKVS